MYLCVGICIWMQVCICAGYMPLNADVYGSRKRALDFTGAGVLGDCESPGMSPGNQTQTLFAAKPFSSLRIIDLHCEHQSVSTVLINGELCLLALRQLSNLSLCLDLGPQGCHSSHPSSANQLGHHVFCPASNRSQTPWRNHTPCARYMVVLLYTCCCFRKPCSRYDHKGNCSSFGRPHSGKTRALDPLELAVQEVGF